MPECDRCLTEDKPVAWVILWGSETPQQPPIRIEHVCAEHLHDAFDQGMRTLPAGRRFWLRRPGRIETKAPDGV